MLLKEVALGDCIQSYDRNVALVIEMSNLPSKYIICADDLVFMPRENVVIGEIPANSPKRKKN